MLQLQADQKTIHQFMGESTNIFLIPDYQRPYSWEEEECTRLWSDIESFAFPNNNCDEFSNDYYFMGSLVLFKNAHKQLEVIDGQQRLITLTLLLRAFYSAYGDNMTDNTSIFSKWEISKCIWPVLTTDGRADMSRLKIISEVASDSEYNEFIQIMSNGRADDESKSRYACNYRLFQKKIENFQRDYPSYFKLMHDRILYNCCILPILTDGQETALRIFSTMNDRGRPLSDSDIFKAKFYRAFSADSKKDMFIQQWREFEETCGNIIVSGKSNPVDDIFMRYMHYLRASEGVKDTTVEGLRDFYSRDDGKFSPLVRDYARTFEGLRVLADFWKDVSAMDSIRFSARVRKSLFILHYVPSNVWTFLVSVYFMTNKYDSGSLDDGKFYTFLQKITGFIIASRIIRPGNSTPFFNAMLDIAQGREASFTGYLFDAQELRRRLEGFDFNDSRKITRGMIAWYVFQDEEQVVLPLDVRFDTEHIYPRKRVEREGGIDATALEALGNKSLLEKAINIRVTDYRFKDKAQYYLGNISGKPPTQIHELKALANAKQDFTKQDIEERTEKIIDSFMAFVRENNLLR